MLPALSTILHEGSSMSIHSKVEIFEGRTTSGSVVRGFLSSIRWNDFGGGRVSEEFKKKGRCEDSNDAGSPLKLHGTGTGHGNGGKQFRSRPISQKCFGAGAALSSPLHESQWYVSRANTTTRCIHSNDTLNILFRPLTIAIVVNLSLASRIDHFIPGTKQFI